MEWVLLAYGLWWASRRGWVNLGSAARAQARSRGGSGSGSGGSGSGGTRPGYRGGRGHASAGWWAGEVSRGLPTFRHGFGDGWREHSEAWHERRADTAEKRDTYAKAVAAHKARMDAARKRRQQATGGSGATLGGAAPRGPSAGSGGGRPGTPARGAKGAGNGAAAGTGGPSTTANGGGRPPDSAGAGSNGSTGTAGSGSAGNGKAGSGSAGGKAGGSTVAGADINVQQVLDQCDELTKVAEAAVNEKAVTAATGLADQIGGAVREDAETLGKAAEVAAAAQKVAEANKELLDSAKALRTRVEQYVPMQDAVPSGAKAPEPEFLDQ